MARLTLDKLMPPWWGISLQELWRDNMRDKLFYARKLFNENIKLILISYTRIEALMVSIFGYWTRLFIAYCY